MAQKDPWNVNVELPNGTDSLASFTQPDGSLSPQRRVDHELIVQIVSERRVLDANTDYEAGLKALSSRAHALPSFQALRASGDYSPEKISAILDELNLEKLPVHARAEQVMMVTGSAGTGKSGLVQNLAQQNPEIYQNAVQINPDDYKGLLADPDALGVQHASYTHAESSVIADAVVDRLGARMDQGIDTPHVLMDITAPYENRMDFAMRFENMTVVHGTAAAETTVQRVYDRGFSDGEVSGRVLPTEIALSSTANSSRLLANVFEHPNLDFTMLNTDVPMGEPPKLIANWNNDTRQLVVRDPDRFIDFIERQQINTHAASPSELYIGADRSPEGIAQNLKPYTDKGMQIDFLNADGNVALSVSSSGVTVNADFHSKRGEGFMAQMAEKFGDLGKSGGPVAGLAFGGLAGAFTLASGGSTAEAAEIVYQSAVPYGETQIDLASSDLEAAKRSATIETASNVGAVGGAVAGAAGGAAIGSVVPVVGTAVGGVVGGVVGGIAGGIASGEAAEFVYDRADDIADWWDESDDKLLERLPTHVDASAPPELQHLVEIKRMLVEAQQERSLLGSGRTRDRERLADRRSASAKIDRIEEMYDEAYDTYQEDGELPSILSSLQAYEDSQLNTDCLLNKASKPAPQQCETVPPSLSR